MKTNTGISGPWAARPLWCIGAVTLLVGGRADGQLATSLTNGDFSTNGNVVYDSTVDHWGEQETYGGPAPNGNGAGILCFFGSTISGASGAAGSLISSTPGANRARIFQSLGTIDASDLGKVFELTGGGAAWDWHLDQQSTANLVASFRTATTATDYGTRLGKVCTVHAGVYPGANAVQDGIGDDGNFLQPFSATFAPGAGDLGTEVFAVYDLHVKQDNSPGGELRYILDNLALEVTSGYSGLATSLANPGFDSPQSGYDPLVDNWLEHESYGGIGPSGAGAGIFQGVSVTGAVDDALVLIPDAAGNHRATVMQSLGFVNAGDLGRHFEFSIDTRAWDWLESQGPTSGRVTVSFRAGMSPDGEAVDFGYGALLGTAGSVTTGLTGGNGLQDGIGDEGDSLLTITASWTPLAEDIGKEVFVAVNIDDLLHAGYGENRYVVDNAVLTVGTAAPPTPLSSVTPANGDFETNGGGGYDKTADQWLEHEHADNGIGIFPGAAWVFADASPPAVGSVIFNGADEPDAYLHQFLGTVAWDWLDRVTGNDGGPYGDGDPDHSARFTISFRKGVDGAEPPSGTLLGTPGSATVGIVNGNGVQGDAPGETSGLVPIAASFIPSAADVGASVHAVILADENDFAASGENRYVLDNVTLGVLEPRSDLLGFQWQDSSGLVDQEAKTVTLTVPYGTELSALAPTCTVWPGATVSPASGTTVDFSDSHHSPVPYTVSAAGVEPTVYSVTVFERPPSPECAVTSFRWGDYAGRLEGDQITLVVPRGTDLTAIAPVFTISPGATSDPVSGAVHDLSTPLLLTVTAEDGVHFSQYLVTVNPSFSQWLAGFDFSAFPDPDLTESGDPDGDGRTNLVEYAYWLDPTLVEDFTACLTRQRWLDLGGPDVADLTGARERFLGPPDECVLVPGVNESAEGARYGTRFRGWLIAPVSGTYHFWITADDQAELWLADGSITRTIDGQEVALTNRYGKRMVASVYDPLTGQNFTGVDQFDRLPGQHSGGIELQAGEACYFEVLHKQDGGGDHVAVAWQVPGAARTIIPAEAFDGDDTQPDDLDDDNLPDPWEAATGLDPADNGLGDPGDGQYGDHDADGLTNLEEYQLGTDPLNTDTDGDGLSDKDERDYYHSDPLVSNQLAAGPAVGLPPHEYSSTTGYWSRDASGSLTAADRRGEITYPFTVGSDPQGLLPGVLEVTLSGGAAGAPRPVENLPLIFSVDGRRFATGTLTSHDGASAEVSVLTPWLTAGAHTLGIFHDNFRTARRLRIDSISLRNLGGLDADENQVPDWLDQRLATNNHLTRAPATSLTSPVCIEGVTGHLPGLVLTADGQPITPVESVDSSFYALRIRPRRAARQLPVRRPRGIPRHHLGRNRPAHLRGAHRPPGRPPAAHRPRGLGPALRSELAGRHHRPRRRPDPLRLQGLHQRPAPLRHPRRPPD